MRFRKDAGLVGNVKDIIDQCLVSVGDRRNKYKYYKAMYFDGDDQGSKSKHNLIYSHIDTISSLLFSSSDLRYTIEPELDEAEEWSDMCDMAAHYLNRKSATCGLSVAFSQALEVALYKQCAFVYLSYQDPRGLTPWVVHPEFFGVYREDVNSLDEQDAFVHFYYVTPSQLWRMLQGNPKAKEIYENAVAAANLAPIEDIFQDTYLRDIIIGAAPGGGAPVSTTPTASGATGSGYFLGGPRPQVHASVASELICVYDLWAIDDDQDDWVMIRYIEPGVLLTGTDRLTNPLKPLRTPEQTKLADDKGRYSPPFTKVCPNEIPGYFWGRSEIDTVDETQRTLNRRVNNVDMIYAKIANPPRAYIGFTGITEEKARAMLAPGGSLIDNSPQGKIDTLAPQLPPGALEYIRAIEGWFHEAGGTTNILTGQGESGVRAGVHANTLLRTSSGRIRDRAYLIEGQAAELGEKAFEILRLKDARKFKARNGKEFLLEQLPHDIAVEVDSHSSSPAFSADQVNLAFALHQRGIIDGVDLLEMIPLSRREELIRKLKAREKQQADIMEELKKMDPEGYVKVLEKRGSGRR